MTTVSLDTVTTVQLAGITISSQVILKRSYPLIQRACKLVHGTSDLEHTHVQNTHVTVYTIVHMLSCD